VPPRLVSSTVQASIETQLGVTPTQVDCPTVGIDALADPLPNIPATGAPAFTCHFAVGNQSVDFVFSRTGIGNSWQVRTTTPTVSPHDVGETIQAAIGEAGYVSVGVTCPDEPTMFIAVGGTFMCTVGAVGFPRTFPVVVTVTGTGSFEWSPKPGEPGFDLPSPSRPNG
jgi:hypothetical protein